MWVGENKVPESRVVFTKTEAKMEHIDRVGNFSQEHAQAHKAPRHADQRPCVNESG